MAEPDIELDALRAEVRQWIATTWDPNATVRMWWAALADAGLAHPTWPTGLGGRGVSGAQAQVILEELARAGTIAPPTGGVGAHLAAPTLLEHGTAEQVRRFLPAIAIGEEAWCQLFSEPGAGSDLASLATRAEPDGSGGWVVTGQKVWSSGADIAQRGLLMARTDGSLPRHDGITYFTLDMTQPGIEARPLRQMNGSATFSEVFIERARVGPDDVVGGVGKGWAVAQTTLAHERRAVANRTPRGLVAVASGRAAGQLDRTIAEVLADQTDEAEISGYAVPERVMLRLARERGLHLDPLMRQRLARYHTANRLNRLTMQRFREARGVGPGAEGSILKLLVVDICISSRDLVFDILGAAATLSGEDAPMDGQIHRAALGSFGSRIGGGTDEVQRNVIGERALGLPR